MYWIVFSFISFTIKAIHILSFILFKSVMDKQCKYKNMCKDCIVYKYFNQTFFKLNIFLSIHQILKHTTKCHYEAFKAT